MKLMLQEYPKVTAYQWSKDESNQVEADVRCFRRTSGNERSRRHSGAVL